MSDIKNTSEKHIDNEMRIIHLMLRYKDAVEELIDSGIRVECFDPVHRSLVQGIYEEFVKDNAKRLLTRTSYQQLIVEQRDKENLVPRMSIYDKCDLKAFADKNDLGHLKKLLMEGYAGRALRKLLNEANQNATKKGFLYALKELGDSIDAALANTETRQVVYASLSELQSAYLSEVDYERQNPNSVITCNIPEIDIPMNVGFKPMHLTLVVADVGGHKTNVMLNIALNISEQGHKVLFVPLEMPWRDLTNRIICNRANINNKLLARPQLLTEEQLERIKNASIWDNKNFAILDAHQRMSLKVLQREVEKRAIIFKPKVVVIDYADIIQVDAKYNSRTLEIGEMLHSLRNLGKQHGFHILSAAQMNRAAIKALREGDEAALDSTAIHGSHSYSTTADSIYGLMKVTGEKDKIRIVNIKARHGETGYTGELNVDPSRYLITSTDGTLAMTTETDLEMDLNRPPAQIIEEKQKPPVAFQGCDLDDLDSNLDDDPLAGI